MSWQGPLTTSLLISWVMPLKTFLRQTASTHPLATTTSALSASNLVITVSYKHGLTSGALSSHQLEQMEDYHPIMSL
eukprot:6881392-Ditylum_brightwellii.AAC.1